VIIIALLLCNIFLNCFLQVRQSKKINQVQNQTSSILYQLINGITKIRTAGAEVRAFHVWSSIWEKMPVMPVLYVQFSPIIGNVISLGGSIMLYLIAWKSDMSASSYIAFQTSFSSFSVSVLALADFGQQLGCLKPAVDMIRPIMEEEPELQEDCEYVKKLQGKIELNNVKFRYNTQMPYVINDMSLCIQPGEYLGIVGSSGCGKSTLMRLLLGFEVPETGSVYFDEKDISNLDLPSLRRRIGVVLQNGSLFTGDILSNLSICAPWLTMDEAWDAARRAGLAEDIENMPMGMFTMLSDDGGGLSGGQKQRLLIARAIAAKPDILLFDEATSALDNQTQATVVQTLKEMECTRLVIAHRLSTIMDCDRIIYLEKGHIVEQGTYEELMAQEGAFAKLAARQLA
jgi:ABC-type bacteriocin/lantibiotic exporter with double-glycine peptidase domain